MSNRSAILEKIYAIFGDWSNNRPWACRKGCAVCCTQNVTVTSPEAEEIIEFVRHNNQEGWLREKLAGNLLPHRPNYTLNTLARACLAGKELVDEQAGPPTPCPFLDNDCCVIYPARPFACRSFLSLHPCSPSRPALADNSHLAAATVVNQLLEHLGQRQPWGNMLDLLTLLLEKDKKHRTSQTLRAQPLPGFMLTPEDEQQVAPLLERILTARVGKTTIEAILNGNASLT